jgi:hypothetical protein
MNNIPVKKPIHAFRGLFFDPNCISELFPACVAGVLYAPVK